MPEDHSTTQPALNFTKEIWKQVVGYEGLYEVSDFGHVRRICAANGTRIERLLHPTPDYFGYLRVALSKNDIAKTRKVHIIVMQAFVGLRPKGKEVNHKDGNKQNAHLDNLEYVTRSENLFHRIRVLGQHGVRGSKNKKAKLTEAIASFIIRNHESERVLAKRFGVDPSVICRVRQRKIWRHVV